MKEILREYGVDIANILAGLSGALLAVTRKNGLSIMARITTIASGGLSANYLTPVVLSWTSFDSDEIKYGVAFMVGLSGYAGVEWILKIAKSKVEAKETKETENGVNE